ncbi:MAG: tyrosine-type recombinase/integrase [Bdellovibrionales bacterium]|nr:tyrosine-type recombinase/integrase [Bdellovibrionales bacterium]
MNPFSRVSIEEFLTYLQLVENKSAHTLFSYKRDLDKFLSYRKIKSSKLFPEYLQGKGLSARSTARAISAVRSYLHWLEDKGCSVDFRKHLTVSNVKHSLPLFINYEEFSAVLKASSVKNHPEQTSRNQLVLMFLFSLGCRVSELVSMQVSDFINTDESIVIKGKGSKQRILPVVDPLLAHLREYLTAVRPLLIRSYKTTSLILNDRGNRPSRVDIWRWIQKWSAKAGLEKKYPHQFRHGCATELLDHGADLRSIQELLGHSSVETTKIYTKVSRRQMQDTIKKHHPLS